MMTRNEKDDSPFALLTVRGSGVGAIYSGDISDWSFFVKAERGFVLKDCVKVVVSNVAHLNQKPSCASQPKIRVGRCAKMFRKGAMWKNCALVVQSFKHPLVVQKKKKPCTCTKILSTPSSYKDSSAN